MIRLYDRTIRQGDVVLIPVSLNEFEARHQRAVVTGAFYDKHHRRYDWGHKGEHGDHAHVLEHAEVSQTLDSEIMREVNLVRIDAVSEALRHIALKGDPDDVHGTQEVPQGLYEVRIMREWKATPDPATRNQFSYGD